MERHLLLDSRPARWVRIAWRRAPPPVTSATTVHCRNWVPHRADTCANRFRSEASLTRCYGRSAPTIAPPLRFPPLGFLTKEEASWPLDPDQSCAVAGAGC